MAKKIQIDIEVNGKMQKATVEAGKLRKQLDGVSKGQDKVSKSARTADRNLKGAAQASSNSTKNFSKMAQGITGGLVPAYATLAANLFAVSAAFQFLKNASQTERLKQAQMEYAQSTGNALGYLSTQLQKASQGMLSFKEAAAASAIGAAKGFSSSQMEALAVSAGKVSKVLGRDFTDAFDRLVRGVSKAEPELLDELGVTLRLEKAKKKYADSLNIAVGAMSDYQISQSILLETQRQINEQFGDIEPNADPFIKLQKTFDDLIQKIATGILPAFQSIATAINNNAGLALGAFAGFSLMILKSIIPMDSLKESMDEWGKSAEKNFEKAQKAKKSYETKLARSRMTSAEFKVEGYGEAQGIAQGAGAQSQAKFMQKLRTEASLTKREIARMEQAITGALNNINKQGIVTSGAFKGMTQSMVLDMQVATQKIKGAWASTDSKLLVMWNRWVYWSKIKSAQIATLWSGAAKKIVKAFGWLGKGVQIVMKIITAAFTFQFLKEMASDIMGIFDSILAAGSKAIKWLTGWDPYEGSGLQKWFKKIEIDAKKQRDLDDLKSNVEDTVEGIEKHFQSAGKGAQTFEKTLNSLSQIDIRSAFDQIKDLETKGMADAAKDLSKRLRDALKIQIPESVIQEGEKSILKYAEAFKELKVQQISFKDSIKSMDIARQEGDIYNMGAAQTKAKEALGSLMQISQKVIKDFLAKGQKELATQAVDNFKKQAELFQKQYGGKNIAKEAQRFESQLKDLATDDAEIEIGFKNIDTLGISKMAKDVRREEYNIFKAMNVEKRAALELEIHSLEMATRSSEKQDEAQKSKDRLRKAELIADKKKAQAETSRLIALKQQNDEIRKQQAIVNNLSNDKRLLDKQKELLDLEQKRVDLLNQQRTATETLINLELEKAVRQAQGPFNAASGVRIASLEYTAQEQLIAIKEKSVQDEFAMKSKQIDLEYDLLEAKQKLLLAELKRDKKKEENIGFQDSFEEQITLVQKTLDALPQMRQLNSQTLDLQKKAAMAEIKAQKSRAAQNLEDAYAIKQLTTEFAGTFRSELAGFLDEWDWGESDKGFKELAVEFGNGIMQSVKSKANEMLAEYITDWLFSGNTTAAKVLGAHMEGATVVATAIDAAFARAAAALGAGAMGTAAGGMLAGGVKSITSADFTKEGNVDWKKQGGAQYASYDGVGVENPNYDPASDTSGGVWETMKQGASDLWTTVSGFFMKMFAPVQAATVANTAATAADTAAKNANTIAAQANTLAKQTETTTTVAATAADTANTTVTATETAAKVANTVSTTTDTVSTGIHSTAVNADTTATAASAATKSASSGPMSWIASLFGAKNGGVMTDSGRMIKGYATGGIASGPRAGFPAILHGREAVVPLPNGRSIPVDMPKGAAGMQNNTVTVNVTNNSDGSSRSEVESSMGDETMGKAIAAAVQKEIINQKRAGGMLR